MQDAKQSCSGASASASNGLNLPREQPGAMRLPRLCAQPSCLLPEPDLGLGQALLGLVLSLGAQERPASPGEVRSAAPRACRPCEGCVHQPWHCSTGASPVLPAQGQGTVAWGLPSIAHRQPRQHHRHSRPSHIHGPSPAPTCRRGGNRWRLLNMHEVQVAQ